MGKEIRSNAIKVETELAKSTHRKFKAKCKKENTSMAQVMRDAIQHYIKS